MQKAESRNPWLWIPSLYYAEGIPYVIVVTVSVVMYKNMGISNTDIALYTSWLYLPWVIKPFWSPVVDLLKTKRFWILVMQILIGAGFAGVAFTIPASEFFQYTLAFFWLISFSSATHDIAADGFYMIPLSQHEQTWFVGIRSTLYRLAVLTGQGPLVILAGNLEKDSGNIPYAWMIVFFILSGMFILFFIYHAFILPHPRVEQNKKAAEDLLKKLFTYLVFLISFIIVLPLYILMVWLSPVTKIDPRPLLKKLPYSSNPFSNTIILFISKDEFGIAAAFLLTYRLGEAQLVKMAIPFLRDPAEKGGLGLETAQVGLLYGTFGLLALTLGGIIGGFAAAKDGLKKWLWPMIFAINLPDLVYVYLSYSQNNDPIVVAAMVVIEQFGYGFGFTAFMLYLIYISEGEYKTSHYAIATGFMALGMMIPGMFSGAVQEWLGYQTFFIWVCISTFPAFIVAKYIPIDPEFGKKVK